MNIEFLFGEYGIHLATFIICLVSGFIPIVNAELFLIAFSSMIPTTDATYVIIIATGAQMLAKSALYLAGRGVIKLPREKHQEKIKSIQNKLQHFKGGTNAFIFISATTGFPMFYFVSIVAGSLRLPFIHYFAYGFIGRLLRFSIVVLFPQLIKKLFFT